MLRLSWLLLYRFACPFNWLAPLRVVFKVVFEGPSRLKEELGSEIPVLASCGAVLCVGGSAPGPLDARGYLASPHIIQLEGGILEGGGLKV